METLSTLLQNCSDAADMHMLLTLQELAAAEGGVEKIAAQTVQEEIPDECLAPRRFVTLRNSEFEDDSYP